MREAIKLPPFGEGVASAEVVAWLVDTGETVSRGQDLLEVQTTKAALTVAAPSDGTLLEQIASPGDELPVGEVLGWLGKEGEADEAAPQAAAEQVPDQPVDPTAALPNEPGVIVEEGGAEPRTGAPAGAGYLSPRVRGQIEELGLTAADLAAVRGTGRGGRLTADDVERYLADTARHDTTAASAARLAIADAMQRSWSRPIATVARRLNVEPILSHRRQIPGRPNLTVYAVRALARILAEDGRLAYRKLGSRFLQPQSLGIGVAVAYDDAVITPTVGGANQGSLAEVSERVDVIIDGVRAGRLAGDAEGAIATVSNYGSLGLLWATPIPPAEESLLLGLGAVEAAPVWNPRAKTWDRQAQCEITLTFDHRIGDGAAAARILHQLAKLLERPQDLE